MDAIGNNSTDGVALFWRGEAAFLSASNARMTFDDGSSYTFVDDLNRPQVINDGGGAGIEISREDDWTEGGLERRLKFYFYDGVMAESRVYDRTEEWLYTNMTTYGDEAYSTTSQITVPDPGAALFHCEYVEFNYYPAFLNCDDFEPCNNITGKFVAQDFYLGMVLDDPAYDPCDLDVYNPCAERVAEGTTECRAVDGQIECIPPELVLQQSDSRQCLVNNATSQCPEPTAACMNEENHADCLQLEQSGCVQILILESCPLQFACDASLPPDTTQGPTNTAVPSSLTATSSPTTITSTVNETGPPQPSATMNPSSPPSLMNSMLVTPTLDPTLSNMTNSTPCPEPTEACMNEENYAVCMQLFDEGCTEILFLESCPLQFTCNTESSGADDAGNSTVSINNPDEVTPTMAPSSSNISSATSSPTVAETSAGQTPSNYYCCALVVMLLIVIV